CLLLSSRNAQTYGFEQLRLSSLRETIEVALIIGIILTYVIKVKQNRLKRDIWIGTGLGIILSVLFGIVFSYVLGSFEEYGNLLEGF
ncbi:unnamed protein product, partial [marine sediment metagenome]